MAMPIKYNLRSVMVRRVSNSMTAAGIALVVAAFVAIMAMVAGLNGAIRGTSSSDNLIVLRRGSTTETASSITREQVDAMRFLAAIRRDAKGNPLVSPEVSEDILMPGPSGSLDSLAIRGILSTAFEVHERVRLMAGRPLTPGLNEVIIGKSLVGRYPGCSLGGAMRFGRRTWQVVGIFEADGSSFESEVWADADRLLEDSNRGAVYNSIRLKLAPGADVPALVKRIADDPRINLQGETESEYYRDQSDIARKLRVVGLLVAVIMGFGAVFAAMNTMYAAVSARTTEIGTLRALGFTPSAIMASFLVESSVLALAAGCVGIILALPTSRLSTTFNTGLAAATLAFNFRVTWGVVVQALVFAGIMGLAGGWLPARQAMKMSIVAALKRV